MKNYTYGLISIFLTFSCNSFAGVTGFLDCKSTDFGMCNMGACASKSQFQEGEGRHGEFYWRFPKSLHFRINFDSDAIPVTKLYSDSVGGIVTTICSTNNPKLITGRIDKSGEKLFKDRVFRDYKAELSCDDQFERGAVRVWNNIDDTIVRYEMTLIGLGVEASAGVCEKSYGFHVN